MCGLKPRCASCHKKSSYGCHRKWCPVISSSSTILANPSPQLYLDNIAEKASLNPTVAYTAASHQRCQSCWKRGWKGHKKWCPTLANNDPTTAHAAGFTQQRTSCSGSVQRCQQCRRKSWKGHRRGCPLFPIAASSMTPGAEGVVAGNRSAEFGRGYASATATAAARRKVEEAMAGAERVDRRGEQGYEGGEAPPPAYDFKV